MAPHSSTFAWKIPWTEEPGRLQSMGSLRVGHYWATSLSLFTFMHWKRKWQPTPAFLPWESQGWESLVGCHLGSHRVRHDWSDSAAAAAVYICHFQSSNSSHPLLPPPSPCSSVCSPPQCLCSYPANRFICTIFLVTVSKRLLTWSGTRRVQSIKFVLHWLEQEMSFLRAGITLYGLYFL